MVPFDSQEGIDELKKTIGYPRKVPRQTMAPHRNRRAKVTFLYRCSLVIFTTCLGCGDRGPAHTSAAATSARSAPDAVAEAPLPAKVESADAGGEPVLADANVEAALGSTSSADSSPIPSLSIVAHAAMRTSPRPPYVRLLVDNPTDDAQHVRILSVTHRRPDGDQPAVVSRVEVYDAEQFTKTGARLSYGKLGPKRRINIPRAAKRHLDVFIDGAPVRYSGSNSHRFVVVAQQEGREPTRIEATLHDGIRHPVRR